MPNLEINRPISEWALQLSPKYRYIFIKGGRSSSKSHEVAGYLVERSICEKNLKILCLREIQKSIKRSSKNLIDDKIKDFGLSEYYKPIESETKKIIEGDDGLFFFQGMNDLTADNIKSLEGFKIAWFEEAQNCSLKSLKTLRPTIRKQDSQIIFTWNPKFPDDPIDEFCNEMSGEPDCLVIHVNYMDNPFLSETVLKEIERDKKKFPENFAHIWLGDYDMTYQGHFYAQLLEQAREQGRITHVPRKAGVDIITAWDLGMRDKTAIWVAQIVGLQPRIIDYMEENFQDLDYYAQWIKDKNYNGIHYLPHDGSHKRLGMQGSIKGQLKQMGLNNIRDLEKISVDAGISSAKTLLKECYFDKEACSLGLSHLRRYRTEKNETTGKWKEVEGDEVHCADAFRYLSQALNQKTTRHIVNRQVITTRSASIPWA